MKKLLIVLWLFAATAFGAERAQQIEFLLSQVRADGVALSGGTATFFYAGTSNLKNIWLDRNKTSIAANPYTLDANATAQLFGDGLYKVVIKNSAGVVKYTRDNMYFKSVDRLGVDISDYSDLTAAVIAIGNITPTKLIINTPTTITGDTTVPSNIQIEVTKTGSINQGVYSLTMPVPEAGRYQIFTGSGTVTFPAGGVVYPEWWGATNNNDCTSAIQKAIDSLLIGGGTINFSNIIYGISSTVTIASAYPISLIGSFSYSDYSNAAYFKPLNNIAGAMIKYTKTTDNKKGGGLVSGLVFVDDRSHTIETALDLDYFNMSRIEKCSFQSLKGSAIRTNAATQSEITQINVRRCGDTGHPALDLAPLYDGVYGTSLNLSHVMAEVNYSEPYINLGYANECKISHIGFEADTDIAATNQNFVHVSTNSNGNSITNLHLNRNHGIDILIDGVRNSLDNIYIAGGLNTIERIKVVGTNNIISNINIYNTLNTESDINVVSTGLRTQLSRISLTGSGRVTVGGAYSSLNGLTSVNTSIATGAIVEATATKVSLSNIVIQTSPANAVKLTAGTSLSASQFGSSITGYSVDNANSYDIILTGNSFTTTTGLGTLAVSRHPGQHLSGNYDESGVASGVIIAGKKITFGPAAPTTGAWYAGDVVYNSSATTGQPKGWRCIAGGTPGTWVSEGNL